MPARRLFQLVLLIALLLAPIGMIGGGAAVAMPSVADAGEHHAMALEEHCSGMGGQRDDGQDRSADLDCRMICSGVLAQTPALGGALAVASVPQNMALVAAAIGMNPAAETPPPRLA